MAFSLNSPMMFSVPADRIAWWSLSVPRRVYIAFKRFLPVVAVAGGLSLLVLCSALPLKLIVPGDLMGGLHPATIDMLVGAPGKTV